MKNQLFTILSLAFLAILENSLHAAEPKTDLPLVFSEDFEKGRERWEATDEKSWTHREVEDNKVFGINRRSSNYRPKVRSPHHIALVKDLEVTDFVLTFRVMSTKDTGGHRDCCIFFNWQDPQNFYYIHCGASPDPRSGQVMIVKNAPRAPLTKNTNKTPWKNGTWHQVKVVRDTKSGKIEIFFDDMTKPHMSVVDKTFGKGRIGIGSFDDMNDLMTLRSGVNRLNSIATTRPVNISRQRSRFAFPVFPPR